MTYPLVMAGMNQPTDPAPKWQDEKPGQISLHGLGFLQVVLQGDQRLHVWHPDLPRRRCFQDSQVHDHRFSFESRVLVGVQRNINWSLFPPGEVKCPSTHIAYKHEGPRTRFGNRPWIPDFQGALFQEDRLDVHPGEVYHMKYHAYHSTQPMGDGRVATLMKKTWEVPAGAHSLCKIGVDPDVNFDRFQLRESEMWSVVLEVLSGAEMGDRKLIQASI